ncbi:hypothetical protein LXT21_26175 [Myxococcus sp. K38C18041901]|uniref:hypothetical protein n=1 Tax=Myxococcus guangdongensis TaxID=2906760 RepID=UPI0020A82D04|nr:hypothetical protein [Myxococcus guangdongensis]MCP3062282.1 hypothetical protein [Myxococcus guangdongensis]
MNPVPCSVKPRFLSTLTMLVAAAVMMLMPGRALAGDGDRLITHLRVSVTTGNDDLRNESHAVAVLKYTALSGNVGFASSSLNNRARWVDRSTHTVDVAMPAGVLLSQVLEFSIEFTSGQPDIFSTGDTWMMNAITVTAILDDGGEVLLLSRAGAPVHTFHHDRDKRWAVDL